MSRLSRAVGDPGTRASRRAWHPFEDRSFSGLMGSETIRLDHGTAGSGSAGLLAELIGERLGPTQGGCVLELDSACVAIETRTCAVDPIIFGEGDIGRLAVCAAINDLAVRGAVPRCLTVSLGIGRALPMAVLARVL